jgi:hypothetical protein
MQRIYYKKIFFFAKLSISILPSPMRAFTRLLRRPRKPVEQSPFVSPHRLDLKMQSGSLEGSYLDLPERAHDPQISYLRREERWIMPASYRTGLAFFTMVMLISTSSLTLMGSQSQAESRQEFLSAQILGGMEELTTGNEHLVDNEFQEGFLVLEPQADREEAQDPLRSLLQSEEINEHEELVQLNSSMSKGFKAFDRFMENWEGIADKPIISQMSWMHSSAQQALRAWKKVIIRARQLSLASFSEEQRKPLERSLNLVGELSDVLTTYDQSYEHLVKALGQEEPQRILIFIQDSYQQRAAGGALSGAVEILLENGEILAWRSFHAEEYDDQLRIQLQAPIGMKQLTDRWDMQTANAYVDAERSAEQIHWFWQREARSSADLILLVSSEALERVLTHEAASGFINEEKAAQIESFALRWSSLSAINDREGLKGLANLSLHAFVDLLDEPEAMIKLHSTLRKQFAQQQVLVYSSQPDQQKIFKQQQVAGSLPSLEPREDLLLISTLNQTEEMTDRWREDDYELHTSLESDGRIKHWLHLSRRHNNTAQTFADDIDAVLVRNMRRQTHRSMLQVLVPLGSELISIDGVTRSDVQVSDFDQFTSWTFPVEVSSGGLTELALSYELPWKFDIGTVDNYRLHLLKQAGAKAIGFKHHLKLPAEMTIFQQVPEEPMLTLDRNRVIAVVAGRNP